MKVGQDDPLTVAEGVQDDRVPDYWEQRLPEQIRRTPDTMLFGHSFLSRRFRAGDRAPANRVAQPVPERMFGLDEECPDGGRCAHSAQDSCFATQAYRLTIAGNHRATAVRLAECALADEACKYHLNCVWSALITEICADDLVRADEHCARLATESYWADCPPAKKMLSLLRARICSVAGDSRGALAHCQEVLAGGAPDSLKATAVAWLVQTLVIVGRTGQALDVLAEQGFAGPVPPGIPGRADLLAARGAVAVAVGRPLDGIAEYSACGAELDRVNITNPAVVPWRPQAALAAISVRQNETAKNLAQTELARARRWGAPSAVGRALYVVAAIDGGRRADSWADEAISLLELAHAWVELPCALTIHGTILRDRNDLGGSRKQLNRAIAIARECGNSYWEAQARAALELVVEPQKLSRQEVEVLKLATVGYRNTEIAKRLSLARRTVEFHLSSIYRKLGVSSRRELPSSAEMCLWFS
ncbi:helix-turn-helix transcriptional regulator [Amycolatopsis sp. NPDC051071]|uniref:helix-turn-helix transcriptional regulator n=1 Tax=Amycolatopsis sp. NPDC051071 TaxID=3154637 RepID=UPI0034229812